MNNRVLLGGVAGGIVMFIWGAVSHMVFGLGDAGMSSISKDEPVLSSMDASIKEPGLYFFPGIDRKHASEEERKQWEEKYRAGPAGLIVYKPVGGELMPPSKLFVQLGMDVGIGLIAALLLQGASVWLGKFASRVAFVSLLGLLPALAVNLPYWNWYGFPPLFTLCQFADRAIGFVLIGVTLGLILRPTAVQLRQSP